MRLVFVQLLIVLLMVNDLHGQGKNPVTTILFQGVVMDAKTLTPLSGSQVWVNRMFTGVTDQDGKFGFYVNTGDTLQFSRLGYQAALMLVSDTLPGRQYLAGIYLNTDTVSIGEVVIMPRASSLKSYLNAPVRTSPETENARYNVAVTSHAARSSPGNLGSPDANYEVLRQKQKTEAYEKGGIPSDRIAGLSPLMLIPAAYLLIHGLPEKPSPFRPDISDYELEQLNRMFRERQKKSP